MFKRELFYTILPQLYHKNAIVITGMRQVGKTTLMRQLFDEFDGTKLWFDLDNPLDQMVFENIDYNAIYRELVRMTSSDENKHLLVCIDEIQNVPEITRIIKYLIDHYGVKFIVTGSSNYYLRNLFPESLSGRKFLYVLPVLSYREFLLFKGKISEDNLAQSIDDAVQFKSSVLTFQTKEFYNEYMEFGGFPEVVTTMGEDTKRQILKNIFASFFEKDIKIFTKLKNVRELRDLILLLGARNGNILDVTKLASDLEISRVKVYGYLEFLEGIFFLKMIGKYTSNIDKSVAGGKKIYFSDTGILNLVAKVTNGQLLETTVANQLKYYGELSFYNKRNTAEIDFVLNKDIAFEVKQKAAPNDLKRLKSLSNQLGIDKYYILSNSIVDIEHIAYPWFL